MALCRNAYPILLAIFSCKNWQVGTYRNCLEVCALAALFMANTTVPLVVTEVFSAVANLYGIHQKRLHLSVFTRRRATG